MVAYNFQSQFYKAIRMGDKRQTIRPVGKRRHARAGDRIQLYSGMRSPKCVKILPVDPVCKDVTKVMITQSGPAAWAEHSQSWVDVPAEAFAIADGFNSYREMATWFAATDGLPFEGLMIRWEGYHGS